MRLPLLSLLLTLLLLPTSPASATDKAVEAAHVHTQTGQSFFRDGKFKEARIEFEAAFALSREPDLLYNVALSWEREGLLREALDAYDRYLQANPTDEDTRGKVHRMRQALSPSAKSGGETKKPSLGLSRRGVAGVSLLSVGMAAIVAAVVSGALTESERVRLVSGSLTYGQAQESASRATTLRALTIAFGSLGGVAVGVGVPLIVWR